MAERDQLLWAESLAFPLASLAAIRRGVDGLWRDGRGLPTGPTALLAGDFDDYAKESFLRQHMTMEYVRAVRNQAWFGESSRNVARQWVQEQVPLHQYVCAIADRFLAIRANEVVLADRPSRIGTRSVGRVSDFPVTGTEFWQRLGTKMCTDLLVAAHLARVPGGQRLLGQRRVEIDGRPTKACKPLTDQHLHLGACIPLCVLWAQALTADVLRKQDPALAATTAMGGVDFRPLMAIAGITRILMAGFLRSWYRQGADSGTIQPPENARCYLEEVSRSHRNRLRGFDAVAVLALGQEAWNTALVQCQYNERQLEGSLGPYLACLNELLTLVREARLAVGMPEPESADPLAAIWPETSCVDPAATIDSALWFWGLRYLRWRTDKSYPRDRLFETLFWQLVRCKNLFHGRLTQQEGFAGLTFFDHHYRRIKPFRRSLAGRAIRLAEAHLNRHGLVGKLEFRIGPPDSQQCADEFRGFLTDYLAVLQSPKGDRAARVALTVHFVKGWAPRREETEGILPYGYPLRGDGYPQRDRRFRYRGYLEDNWKKMESLCALLRRSPALSCFLRGIDVANRERTIPNWIIAHLFQEFRARLQPDAIGVGSLPRPMQFTAHAGEEFEHPITGLRHLHEVLRWFGYQEGDRVGHAVSLGLDLKLWAKEHSSAYVPVEEYLDDLVWQWTLFESQQLPNKDDITQIEWEIGRVAAVLFEGAARLQCNHRIAGIPLASTLASVYRLRFERKAMVRMGVFEFDGPLLRLCGSYRGGPFLSSQSDDVLQSFLFCEHLWRHALDVGNWRVLVDRKYLDRANRIQYWLRGEFARRGVVVETCPSSNRLIGDLGWHQRHPVFQFRPLGTADAGLIYFTVNADDPLTFNTNVAEELGHLRQAMIENMSAGQLCADRWIEDAIDQAWRTSFVFEFRDGRSGFRDADAHRRLGALIEGIMRQLATP